MLKIACVDYREWYSPYLIDSLNRLDANINSSIYLPKFYKDKPFSQVKRQPKNTSNNPKIWSTYTFPFDILKKALSDKVNLVHIQWEFNEFGVFYASLLLPLLLLFLRIANKKCVVTIHSIIPRFSFGLKLPGFTLPRGSKSLVHSGFILLYKMVVSLSNATIVHGKSLKALLSRDYKCPSNKIFVIPYGIPLHRVPLSKSKFDSTFSKTSEVILALGAVSPRKGLDTLIKAFRKLSPEHPTWTLVIAGRVPPYYQYYYHYLEELSADLVSQGRVLFLGEFDPQDTDSLVSKSSVVVFPYIYNFGVSSTLTFALQHRKVVIISKLNFSEDLLTDGKNALIVPPEDPSSLANAIDHALNDGALRNRLQIGVDNLMALTSWDFAARETLKVYNNIFSKP
jgi:glycosyltransferase involved in cell wall biosynthesis